jgi:hypothetical protein
MRFVCLIHIDETALAAVPPAEMDELNAGHVALNGDLQRTGHFIEAEALGPSAEARHLRVREGRVRVTDGPYAETKEVVAGVYLIEAADLDEATAIAARMPGARIGTVEVRPTRRLTVDGVQVW